MQNLTPQSLHFEPLDTTIHNSIEMIPILNLGIWWNLTLTKPWKIRLLTCLLLSLISWPTLLFTGSKDVRALTRFSLSPKVGNAEPLPAVFKLQDNNTDTDHLSFFLEYTKELVPTERCMTSRTQVEKQLVAMQSAPALVGTPKFMMVGWLCYKWSNCYNMIHKLCVLNLNTAKNI